MKNYSTKFNHRITLRLEDSKYNYLLKLSKQMGMSPSKVIRLMIDEAYYTDQYISDNGGDSYENR